MERALSDSVNPDELIFISLAKENMLPDPVGFLRRYDIKTAAVVTQSYVQSWTFTNPSDVIKLMWEVAERNNDAAAIPTPTHNIEQNWNN